MSNRIEQHVADLEGVLDTARESESRRLRCEELERELDSARGQIAELRDALATRERRLADLDAAATDHGVSMERLRQGLQHIGNMVGWNLAEHPADALLTLVVAVRHLRDRAAQSGAR